MMEREGTPEDFARMFGDRSQEGTEPESQAAEESTPKSEEPPRTANEVVLGLVREQRQRHRALIDSIHPSSENGNE